MALTYRQRYKGISLSSYSPEEIARKQIDEPALRWLVGSLESGIVPQNSKLILSGPVTLLTLIGDRLLVPSTLRQEVMSTIHDIPSSGHQGVQRTKAKAREMFYWWKMGTDIKTYVLACDVCCRNKRGPLPSRAALKSYQAGSPMEKVHLDFLKPLPRTEVGMSIS